MWTFWAEKGGVSLTLGCEGDRYISCAASQTLSYEIARSVPNCALLEKMKVHLNVYRGEMDKVLRLSFFEDQIIEVENARCIISHSKYEQSKYDTEAEGNIYVSISTEEIVFDSVERMIEVMFLADNDLRICFNIQDANFTPMVENERFCSWDEFERGKSMYCNLYDVTLQPSLLGWSSRS